jgi:uncharacterized SAM-binding protein YcdF (DUF218 family)
MGEFSKHCHPGVRDPGEEDAIVRTAVLLLVVVSALFLGWKITVLIIVAMFAVGLLACVWLGKAHIDDEADDNPTDEYTYHI